MIDPDGALFAVRVLGDKPSWWATYGSFVSALLGVVVGAGTTFMTTWLGDRRRDRIEAARLVWALRAELAAAKAALDLHTENAKAQPPSYAFDTLRYTVMPDDYAPVSRAAAAKSGLLHPAVAESLAKYLIWMANAKQFSATLREMRVDGALTQEKLEERLRGYKAPLQRLVDSRDELASVIDTHYPPRS